MANDNTIVTKKTESKYCDS